MACEYSLKLLVIGIVQGVGFRPFIYRAASRAGVKGYVRNLGGSEVEVLIQGNVENVHKFLHLLASEMPPPARIEEISGKEMCIDHLSEFKILPSLTGMGRRSMIPQTSVYARTAFAKSSSRGVVGTVIHLIAVRGAGPGSR